ncbi:hypothetical protein NLJ89_g3711 [Agrocybe chaxingu]|uniref:F-box domain-containing protein n=1 Tax=Agrocybe chaxingu TaxID=84603 RepID=A0A9W8MY66_9AGAR|nr:hypothetical protein NLJ89_g3711 [Agrocybe chaxingu]
MTSIHDLPIELLSRIFFFLYKKSREEVCKMRVILDTPADDILSKTEWADKDPRSLTLFPHAQAKVCQHWLNVLSTHAMFWDRVIFDIREDPTRMLDSLRWSKDLPLEIFVFNSSPFPNPEHDDLHLQRDAVLLELSRFQALILACTPHIKRCTSIVFEAMYPTSLPPCSLLLQYKPWDLRTLVLTSVRAADNPHSSLVAVNPSLDPPSSLSPPVQYRSLKLLCLDAFILMSFARMFEGRGENFASHKMCLVISRYIFQYDKNGAFNEPFTVDDFLDCLEQMSPNYTTLRDLVIQGPHDEQPTLEPPTYSYPFSTHTLLFENVSAPLLSAYFDRFPLEDESVEFRFCDIPAVPDESVVWCYFLTLENIPASTDLRGLLTSWVGGELKVKNCPCFDDSLLSWLARDPCQAPHLRSLEIENCNSFTMKKLRKLIRLRTRERDSSEVSEEEDDDFAYINTLFVCGDNYALTAEELSWFTDRVDAWFTISQNSPYIPL